MMWESYSSFGYTIIRNVAEGLVNRNPKNELVGELATKWEATTPTNWRFYLRPNVKFHDGTPFNAEAAAFSLNWTWSKENNFRIRTFIGPEFKVTPVDDLTLDVTTESPDPILPERLYFSPINSMKQAKEKTDEVLLKAIGTGPYVFQEWVKGQHIKLTASPDWWGNGAGDAQGTASIKDVTFHVPRRARGPRGDDQERRSRHRPLDHERSVQDDPELPGQSEHRDDLRPHGHRQPHPE